MRVGVHVRMGVRVGVGVHEHVAGVWRDECLSDQRSPISLSMPSHLQIPHHASRSAWPSGNHAFNHSPLPSTPAACTPGAGGPDCTLCPQYEYQPYTANATHSYFPCLPCPDGSASAGQGNKECNRERRTRAPWPATSLTCLAQDTTRRLPSAPTALAFHAPGPTLRPSCHVSPANALAARCAHAPHALPPALPCRRRRSAAVCFSGYESVVPGPGCVPCKDGWYSNIPVSVSYPPLAATNMKCVSCPFPYTTVYVGSGRRDGSDCGCECRGRGARDLEAGRQGTGWTKRRTQHA